MAIGSPGDEIRGGNCSGGKIIKHEVSFGCDSKRNKRSTHLLLLDTARYDRYRSVGGMGRSLQLRGDASEARSGSLISPPPAKSSGGNQTRGGTRPERGRGRNRHIMVGRGVGVDWWGKGR